MFFLGTIGLYNTLVLGLRNILLESGFTINQTIEIIIGDDSEDQMQFLKEFNRIDKGWCEEIQPPPLLSYTKSDGTMRCFSSTSKPIYASTLLWARVRMLLKSKYGHP